MLDMSQAKAKWAPILEHADLAPIRDSHRASVTAQLLENTVRELGGAAAAGSEQSLFESSGTMPVNAMGGSSSTQGTGGIDTFDPVLISLVRRSAPNLLAYDICGVQPMTGPTGLIFAMRSRYSNQTGSETFYNEVNTAFSSVLSGANTFGQKNIGTAPLTPTQVGNTVATGVYNTGTGMTTAQAEALGVTGNTDFAQMSMSIEKVTVTAKSRALKAEYTLELAQDLKAIHGLDAETELANILSQEILAEINREVVRTINIIASIGAQDNTTTPGIFDLDTDSNGRWAVEKWKGMMFQLDRECNAIARATRRGKGNIAIMTSDVASALAAAGVLSLPQLPVQVNVDDTGSTFIGMIGNIKAYIDPYAFGNQYITVGYKGQSAMDAGLFYCPYVPLQMVRAVDPSTFTPKIGFKTRYGMVANPYAEGLNVALGALNPDKNLFYRKLLVSNLL